MMCRINTVNTGILFFKQDRPEIGGVALLREHLIFAALPLAGDLKNNSCTTSKEIPRYLQVFTW